MGRERAIVGSERRQIGDGPPPPVALNPIAFPKPCCSSGSLQPVHCNPEPFASHTLFHRSQQST